MVTEDNVSFETANLLKEKGFDELCYACYEYFESGVTVYKGWTFEYKGYPVHNSPCRTKSPTLQMAMKWLREIHNICISVDVKIGGGKYYVCISSTDNGLSHGVLEDEVWDTYEEACEAGIRYCLENLI